MIARLAAAALAGLSAAQGAPADGAEAKGTMETATFGAGCYWCVEAVLQRVSGVTKVTPGFMGGSVERPTYKQVCSGATGHAEVVQVEFDPTRVSYGALLDLFWRMHDPTTKDRQGADRGTQYRSAIYYHSDAQRQAAEESRRKAQEKFRAPIVTEIVAASAFWPAGEDHRDYYNRNRGAAYCRFVIDPKLEKLGMKP
jgi:peptide-methionine (S)-S-oxide reductase